MLARLPMARMRVPATITTEFEIGGPPVPSISTAPMMAFCRDSSGGLHAARHNAAIARSQTLSGRANTHPSCQNSSCVWRRELKKKLECGPAARPHSPLRRLLGFSEPAGTGDELDAIERAFAVDVPVLFQLVERTGFRRPLSAIHPFGVVVVDHLPLRVVFHHRDGGRVLIDHMDRPVQLPLLGFLFFGHCGSNNEGQQNSQAQREGRQNAASHGTSLKKFGTGSCSLYSGATEK